MSANSGDFKTKSKSLIADNEPEDDENNDPQNLTGNINTTGVAGGNFTVTNSTNANTIIVDQKDKK
jgi:hypothetical protein